MEQQQQTARPGDLSWRLSSHPITLLCFIAFRISSLLVYLFGLIFFFNSYVFVFILTMLLLAADFYYIKNIAGRRLVGLRWWNEVDTTTGDSHWVFESQDRSGGTDDMGNARPSQNMTDKRFFWLAVYVQPAIWIVLGVLAIVRLKNPIWLIEIVIALTLTITNTLAFSRCDKFSQASNLASSAFYSGNLARNVAGGIFSRFLSRG